jgi:hypothetical protein
MVERFGSARAVGRATILQVAADFDSVATEAVQDPQARPAHELIAAQTNFDQLVQTGRFLYYEDGTYEYGDIEHDSEEEEMGLPVSRSSQAAG